MGRGKNNNGHPGMTVDPRDIISGKKSKALSEEEKEARINKKRLRKLKIEPPTRTDSDGNKFWENENGERHRDGDLPAVIYAGDSQYWYQNDRRHRDGDKPAVVHSDGRKEWYQNDKRHRDNDKPAVIEVDGGQFWYQNDERHRDDDKPAVIYADGSKAWWVNGEKIREENP